MLLLSVCLVEMAKEFQRSSTREITVLPGAAGQGMPRYQDGFENIGSALGTGPSCRSTVPFSRESPGRTSERAL